MTLRTTSARDNLDRAEQSLGVERLRDLSAAVENIDAEIRRVAYDLRREGSTWAQIGEALGVTRQAAQQRYGRG